MQLLGDLFPDSLKEKLASNQLKVGSVLRYHVDNTTPPKIKRMVIVGFDREVVFFVYVFINSDINPNMFPTPVLRDLHIELDPKGRTYLDHNSFVDCSKIREDNVEYIKSLLTIDSNIHIGNLSEDDCSNVLEKIRTAKTISVAQKRKYGLL